MGPFGDSGDIEYKGRGLTRDEIEDIEELTQERELTKDEIKYIKEKTGLFKKQAREKEFCHKAVGIVTTIDGEPHPQGGHGEVRENGLLVVLKDYWKLPANFFESEEITYEVLIYYDSKLVFNGERVYEDHRKYKLRVDEIKSYLHGEWEQEFFGLYDKLSEYKKEREEQEKQNKARESMKRFHLTCSQ